jgi:O-antigen ligase
LLGIFFVTFFIVDCLSRYNQHVLLEFKNAILLLMIFFVIQHIQIKKVYIIRLFKIYLFSASIISSLGILEFLFPSTVAAVFGYQDETVLIDQTISFSRLAFLFWGSHLAANLIPPVFLILLLLKAEKDPIASNNSFLTFLVIINLFAIYLSGNRISWLVLTVLLIATLFQYRSSLLPNMKSYILLVTISFVAYIYSQPVEGRYLSTFKALTGEIDTRFDSSGCVRLARAKIAMASIASHPLGTGWGSQGWVHSDILQISATIGIIPGVIFLFVPLFLLLRCYRCYLTTIPEQKTVFFVLCGLLIFIIISIGLNGNIYLVQCGAPLFLLMALAYAYLENYNNIGHSYSL